MADPAEFYVVPPDEEESPGLPLRDGVVGYEPPANNAPAFSMEQAPTADPANDDYSDIDVAGMPGTGMWGGAAPMSPTVGAPMVVPTRDDSPGHDFSQPPPDGRPVINPRPALPQGPPIQRGGGGRGVPNKAGTVPENLRQHGGFYYQPEYLSDLNDALMDGSITEKTYEGLLKKYQTNSTGLRGQQFGLDVASAEQQSEFAQEDSKLQGEHDYYAGVVRQDARKRVNDEVELHNEQRETIRAHLDQEEQKLQTTIAEHKAMKVDPNKHWSKASIPGRIMAGLALAMGAVGASLAKTPNFAMQQLMADIDNDLAAQRSNIEKAGADIANQRGIVGDMYAKLGDLDKAEQAAKLRIYDQLGHDLGEMSSHWKGKLHQKRAAEAAQFLEMEKAKAKLGYKLQAQLGAEEAARQMYARRAGIAASRAAARKKEMARLRDPLGGLNWMPAGKFKKSEFYLPGIGFAPDAKTRSELATSRAQDQVVFQNLRDMRAMVDRLPFASWNDADKARYNALRESTINLASVAGGQGTVTEGEAPRWEKIIPDATQISQGKESAKAGLGASENMFRNKVMPYYQAHDVIPGTKRRRIEDGKYVEEVAPLPTAPQRAERAVDSAGKYGGYKVVR